MNKRKPTPIKGVQSITKFLKPTSPFKGSRTPEKTQSSSESASTPEGKLKQSLRTPIKVVRSENDATTIDFQTPEKLKSSGADDNLILKESVLSNFRNNLSKSPILKQKMNARKSEIAAATEADMSVTEDGDGPKSSKPLKDDNNQNDSDRTISEAPLAGSGNHSLILQPKPDIIPCTSSGDKKSVSLLSDDDDLLLNDDDDGSLSLPNDDDDLLLKDDDDILGIDDTNNDHDSDGVKTSCTLMNVEISLSENEVTITDFQTPEKLESSGPNDDDKMDVKKSEVAAATEDDMSATEDGAGPTSFVPLEDGYNQDDSDKTISDALVLSPAGSLQLDQSDNDADKDEDNDVDDDKDEDSDNDNDDDDDVDDDDSDYTIEYDEGDSDELETNITTRKAGKVDIEILNSNSSSSQESLILAKPVVMEDRKVKSKSNVSFSSGYSAFSLDALLAEKDDIEVKNKDLLDMQKELKGDIERGGFVKVFNEQVIAEAEMLPEQEKELEKLQVTESLITEEHPGENMFSPRLFSQLFNESLKPISCGFSPGNSLIDQLLSNLQTELLADFLASGIVTMCFSKISCPEAICKWLYYIMSVHKNGLVVHGCQRLLMEIIQDQNSGDDDSPTWSPSPLDLLQIFINYGAEKDVILPEQCFYSTEQISKVLQRMSDGQWEDDANNNNNNNCMYLLNRDNLTGVLDTLSCALQARPELVSEEITFIIEILVKAAVDNTFKNDMCHNTFQVAISSAIECYKNTSWPALVPDLCRRLSRITSHHHNRVYLIQLLPSGHRGHYIQQRLATMFLHEEMTGRVLNECPETIQIQNLFMYVGYMKTLIKNIDLYKLSSCIMLMDMVVGNENIPLAQKAYLSKLAERINVLKGDLRDSVMMLDKTRVKDLMVRVSSKWTLMISTMGSTQRSLLPWARQTSPQKMRVETLKTQSDHESDNSDLDDDSQSNLNIREIDTVSKVSGGNAKTKVNRNKNSDSSAIGNSSAKMSSASSVASSVISMDSDSDELPEL